MLKTPSASRRRVISLAFAAPATRLTRALPAAMSATLALAPSSAHAMLFFLTSKTMADWPELKRRIREKFPKVPVLTVPELRTWQADAARAKPLLIDVRSAAEFAVSHLPGAVWAKDEAQVIALAAQAGARPAAAGAGTAPQAAAEAQPAQVVLYCSVGYRSARIAEKILEMPMERAFPAGPRKMLNLEGSLFEWANAGYPLVKGAATVQHAHPFDAKWGGLLEKRFWSPDWKG
jgi:rhodanese-related sulfurtransferase